MTTISENDGTNSSWLKQRATIFNNSTGNKSSAKVVDKELARLKNMGAVSSVWSNKFVKEDNSGGTTENKNKRITPPLSPRQRYKMLNDIDISPRPNANYIPGSRQTMTSPTPQPISPRSPVFNNRVRTLSASNKKMAQDIKDVLQQDDSKTNIFGYFSKNSMSSLDLNETKSSRSSVSSTTSSIATSPIISSAEIYPDTPATSSSTNIDEAASLWFQCETLKTQFAQSNSKLSKANEDIEFYKRQLEQNGEVARQNMAAFIEKREKEDAMRAEKEKTASITGTTIPATTSIDEAASLWFQCETLKTQFAQNNAKLLKANEDIEFYKRQLEQGVASVKDKEIKQNEPLKEENKVSPMASPRITGTVIPETTSIDEAASLWFQCETLKTQYAQSNARLVKANEDNEFYKRQLEQGVANVVKDKEIKQNEPLKEENKVSPMSSPRITGTVIPETTSIDEAASLWFQCETLKTQFAQSNARLLKANEENEFYKRQLEQSVASVKDKEIKQNEPLKEENKVSPMASPRITGTVIPETTSIDEAASLWFQCETLKTQFAQSNARLLKANEDIEFYKRQLEQGVANVVKDKEIKQNEPLKEESKVSPMTSPRITGTVIPETTSIDEAASLWFQCETLKTQFAQSNARLLKANEDIDFYKRQLEQNDQAAREGMVTVAQDKERETLRVRQLAELIVKQDKLLGEYEIHLESLTKLTNESAYSEETQEEMVRLRQEVSLLNKQKVQMEGAIASLRAELEMSYDQMRLMMRVSTEIQNEFDSYKEKIDSDIKQLLNKKQVEYEANLKALKETISTTNISNGRSVNYQKTMTNHEDSNATAAAAVPVADNEKVLSSLRDQITTLTEALKAKETVISEVLQAKEKAVSEANQANKALEEKNKALSEALQNQETTFIELENMLRNQKMSSDAQMMELNQTILEKDTLLMEFMSSRNNSREVISAAASMSSPSTTVPVAAVTDTYYHPYHTESRLHINQIRDYMFSSSEDEEEESEVLMMSYTTDEEDQTTQHHDHYRHMINTTDTNASSTPQSPADTISSAISFDSDDDEEEKIAEIKHLSYSSVQSQSTRPGSYMSTSGSISGNDDLDMHHSNMRNSATGISKELKTASWPMPPPTPPPSEPLPPVPVVQVQDEIVNTVKETISNVPPPRRARSKTMARDEAPDMSVYITSIHQNNQLPRIIPSQKTDSAPIAPPRKDLANLNINQVQNSNKEGRQHTQWMDDPESEEEELWCEATGTPKQATYSMF